ncbi:Protein of uncharacterised function (DUF3667) [Chryseobacterium nakagawai]|uniref:DUF3667 domain-containing protein n=1 Tax=Chryseobacterium nakagawai TaxID=1241982 RepID=A0AAD1DQL9_CHRNA|nr:DUF3667 domain-containing protein [Chryseobacterium nakagawai]AZA89974.1 DUF3667 domain-containing protein [Chryseobacterium nakagawai]VEH21395.1 Protein of uncharacterised function (DUF3667) [Chryseobacterium nakagawai]
MNEDHSSGPQKEIKRIDANYISHEIQHLLHFDKGFPFTFKEVLIRPGKAVREYLKENREKYVKPIVFLVFAAVLYTFIIHLLHIEVLIFNIKGFEETKQWEHNINTEVINNWIDSHLGYSALIIGFFMALWTKIFFYRKGYNLFEIFVLLAYLFGVFFISLLFFLLLSKLTGVLIITQIGVFLLQIYFVCAIGQFFGEKVFLNYVKSLICLFLGVVTYKYTLILLAYLIHLFK